MKASKVALIAVAVGVGFVVLRQYKRAREAAGIVNARHNVVPGSQQAAMLAEQEAEFYA